MSEGQLVVLTLVGTAAQRKGARLLIDSLRSFGGYLRDCPIWVFEAHPEQLPCRELAGEDVSVYPLALPESLHDVWFGGKVAACAQAETLVGDKVCSLVWLAADCLVIQPPALLDLPPDFDIAVRPVHHRNIGLRVENPLDPFWQGVYKAVGLTDLEATVETFVEGELIRAYFNSHLMAVNPALELFGRWLTLYERLVTDHAFQSQACADVPHRIFLHQAVLSALIATTVPPERLLLLPSSYCYPYNLHASVPANRKARTLNELVCIAYEERSLDPLLVADIEINEPLRSWLCARTLH